MAVWQVEFHIVPRRAVAASLTPAVLNETDWWATAAFPSDYQRRFASVGPPGRSPSTDLEKWGPEDGNRVDVWSAGGRVSRAMARVDVRRLDSKFGAALLAFVRAAGAVLIRSDGLIVEPLIGAYAAALRNSDSWRFASDPTTFLASQSTVDDDDDDDDDE
jgi:hypothetical protein